MEQLSKSLRAPQTRFTCKILQIYLLGDTNILSGALKSNIGHLGGASGIASVIKTVLVLERGFIPPNTNFETLNPKINADELCLMVRADELI